MCGQVERKARAKMRTSRSVPRVPLARWAAAFAIGLAIASVGASAAPASRMRMLCDVNALRTFEACRTSVSRPMGGSVVETAAGRPAPESTVLLLIGCGLVITSAIGWRPRRRAGEVPEPLARNGEQGPGIPSPGLQ